MQKASVKPQKWWRARPGAQNGCSKDTGLRGDYVRFPLRLLQFSWAGCRFSNSCVPPFVIGTMWSTWNSSASDIARPAYPTVHSLLALNALQHILSQLRDVLSVPCGAPRMSASPQVGAPSIRLPQCLRGFVGAHCREVASARACWSAMLGAVAGGVPSPGNIHPALRARSLRPGRLGRSDVATHRTRLPAVLGAIAGIGTAS